MTLTETITWISVAEKLPDDGVSVLIAIDECDDPVWIGFHDEDVWRMADGCVIAGLWRIADGCVIDDGIVVTHWAELPGGPKES